MSKKIDMVGMRFGKLVVIEQATNSNCGPIRWRCICDCGNEVFRIRKTLVNPGGKSCGCVVPNKKHGCSLSSEYRVWAGMMRRCTTKTNIAYSHYGGRGITVCPAWRDFANFIIYMGPRPSPKHTLERINNDGNYEPGNCRWATQSEQCRNTRRTIFVTINGIKKCLKDWCVELGKNYDAVRSRIRYGATPIKALCK